MYKIEILQLVRLEAVLIRHGKPQFAVMPLKFCTESDLTQIRAVLMLFQLEQWVQGFGSVAVTT